MSACWLEGIVFLLAGALIGWGIAHAYYRRTRHDLNDLRASIERLPVGIVDAVRNAGGQIKIVKAPPNAPTDLRLFTGPRG
jgi:hypothetical protein